jgi:ubiquinone/menaquinone biosynthesis C-methylase UbiE
VKLVQRCPARLAFLLEHPIRRRLLAPDRLVGSLRLRPGIEVLDLGAGSGVVAGLVADAMSSGRITLVDAQQAMLTRARRRLRPRSRVRIRFVRAVAERLPFGPAFEVVLPLPLLGELHDRRATLREAHRVLRPSGLLSISEHLPDPDFRSIASARALTAEAGFEERELLGGRWSYTLNVAKITAES